MSGRRKIRPKTYFKPKWDTLYADIAKRLALLWKGETYDQVDARLGVPRGCSYDLVVGKKRLSLGLALRISEKWEVSLLWLLGKGQDDYGFIPTKK